MAEAEHRIRIGREVRDRLARAPGAMKIPSEDLDLFVVRDFLGEAECGALIAEIDAHRIPSQVLAPTGDPEFRTSESCNLNPFDPMVQAIEAKIAGLTGIDPSHGETIQGQRYAPGQQFKLHHDFFHTDQPYWEEMERSGGQRTWTAMVFLNQVEAGGQISFDNAAIRVTPRTGNLLAWNNLDAAGEPNYFSMHRGMPVIAGVKYVITKWHRERPWSITGVQTY
jgi:prolyl 4-hydroxylase